MRTFKRIRIQLPLTYAGIALLTTLLIGSVLYLTVGSYYHGLEQQSLADNASGFAKTLMGPGGPAGFRLSGPLIENQDYIKKQVQVAAFLFQSRVEIIDAQGQLVADSGMPDGAWIIAVPPPSEPVPAGTPDNVTTTGSASISIAPAPTSGSGAPPNGFHTDQGFFGYQLQGATTGARRHANLQSVANLYDRDGSVAGQVEVSSPPDVGQVILSNVLKGWAVASLVALVISIVVGWWVSRQITRPIQTLETVALKMKDGNLAVRAPRLRLTELDSFSETFNQMAERIQGNVTTLRAFVGDAAHEIRTPLTALTADLNLALSQKALAHVQALVTRSLDHTQRLDQLSKDLLDLSRLETEGESLPLEEVDLPELLLETSEIHASAAEQAGVDFQVILDKQHPGMKARTDRVKLQRALNNLLENAVKFTPPGGRVTLKLGQEENWARISVEDTGIGIPVEERALLFSRFHRSRNASTYPGSGLGLAIARAIMHNLMGEIGYTPGEKTTVFYLKVPRG